MRKFNAFVLALAVATVFAVGAFADGKHKKHPGLWFKAEFVAKDPNCFTTVQGLFCPYDAVMPSRRYTTLGTEDLPPISERVGVRPSHLQLSQNQ